MDSTARSSGLTPCLRANPATACAGADFARAHDALLAIGLALGQPFGAQHQAARRGIQAHGFVRNVRAFRTAARRFSSALGIIQSGISSVPISSRKGRLIAPPPQAADCWSAQACATPTAIFAHALNHADALGDADRAARIERIKEVGTFQHVVVSGQQRKALLLRRLRIVELQQPRRFALVQLEQLPQRRDVGHLEVVDRILQLVA